MNSRSVEFKDSPFVFVLCCSTWSDFVTVGSSFSSSSREWMPLAAFLACFGVSRVWKPSLELHYCLHIWKCSFGDYECEFFVLMILLLFWGQEFGEPRTLYWEVKRVVTVSKDWAPREDTQLMIQIIFSIVAGRLFLSDIRVGPALNLDIPCKHWWWSSDSWEL